MQERPWRGKISYFSNQQLSLKHVLQFESIQDAKREKVKTKEQLAEEKRISLSIRIKQLELDGKSIYFYKK